MGFLKFLKRDKDKETDFGLDEDLDIPPPPPDFSREDFGKAGKELPEFPEFPEIPEAEESAGLPELKDEIPTAEFPEQEIPEEKPLPPLKFPEEAGREFPEETPFPKLKIPGKERFQQPRPALKPSFQAPRPLFPRREPPFPRPSEKPEIPIPKPQIKPSPYQALEKEASREEMGMLRHKKTKGPIYVRIERFRDILANTNTVKNNLRISSQSIERLNEIDENRDKVFDKWHSIMMDMQKKFIFMDKSVFKQQK